MWRLDGQVFGQTTYSFTDPTRFDTGKLTVTIDETTNRQVAAVQSLVVEDRGVNGGIHVELTPRPGVITGRTPVTTVLTPRFTDVHVQAVGPNGVTAAPASNAPDGAYSINPAAAGTWSLSYSANGDVPPDDPRDYSLATGSAATVTTLVNPGAAVDLGATTFVEHPRIDFLVTDSAGNPINVNGVTPTLNITPLGGLGAPASQQTDPVTGRTIFRRLAFNPANPLALVGYGWSVDDARLRPARRKRRHRVERCRRLRCVAPLRADSRCGLAARRAPSH